jgi:Uma2 family endonuclease
MATSIIQSAKTVLLFDVSRSTYQGLVDALAEHHFRHTYDNGTLEMMSPSNEREWIKRFMGRLIEMTTWELKISIRCVGSATQRSKLLMQGLEPDESYYIGHDPVPRLGRHAKNFPPPELVVEVDLRTPDLNRLKSYAAIGVGEVWRFRQDKVEIFLLDQEQSAYHLSKKSQAFPLITSVALTRFVKQSMVKEERVALEGFMAWLRKQVAKD